MTNARPRRVMWLLNHSSARAFEIPMLKRIGITEIFQPKSFPQEYNFRSASVDYSQDEFLTIPADDLRRLNAINWYEPVAKDDWDLASRHFDLAFFILHNLDAVGTMAKHFTGALLLRAYGLPSTLTYSLVASRSESAARSLHDASSRLWLAEAYKDLRKVEQPILRDRAVYLPLGLPEKEIADHWVGSDKRIMFVCPEINSNPYYENVFRQFEKSFGDLPHMVGGAQPVRVANPNVAGFIPPDEFDRNMRELAAMFYHSTEPRQVHYHPFEAVRAGMPLVFMAGGLLDTLGGLKLPGRARTIKEARSKLQRLLNGDRDFIAAIRATQPVLLDAMSTERAEPHWRQNLTQLLPAIDSRRPVAVNLRKSRKRVAVIVPVGYRGGILRGAKLVAEALYVGSRQANEDADVVFAHVDDPEIYTDAEFSDLSPNIIRRPFRWRGVDNRAAKTAMELAGYANWQPTGQRYLSAWDGINNLLDCDAWVFISDRLEAPVLPIRPRLHVIYDYIQRYTNIIPPGADTPFLDAARRAEKVLVTTNFTKLDAIQYAGVDPKRVSKVPMLVAKFRPLQLKPAPGDRSYFVWTTNTGPHKNHLRAMQALALYYGKYDGQLTCRVTGVNSAHLFDGSTTHLAEVRSLHKSSAALQSRVELLGELSDDSYRETVARSAFLWHPALIDNGTFSVIEAAGLGIPSLSSDYPAMREIDQQFVLNLRFAAPTDVDGMARGLKAMEENLDQARAGVPSADHLGRHDVANYAGQYWAEVREWL